MRKSFRSLAFAALSSCILPVQADGAPKSLGDTLADVVYTPLAVCRLVDTRGFGAPIQGGPFASGERRSFAPAGACAIPGSGVTSLLISFAAQNLTPGSGGYLSALAPGAPVTGIVGVFGTEWISSNTTVATGLAGQFDVYVNTANAHVVIDVLGYFRAPTNAPSLIVQDGNSIGATVRIGTNDNQPLELEVNGARALRLEPNAVAPNLIGGSPANTVVAGVGGATIAGGGSAGTGIQSGISSYTCSGDCSNRVTDLGGTVGGGFDNVAGDDAGTTTDALAATVAGGMRNDATAGWSFIGGGDGNTASGLYSTVGGGTGNLASGVYATVAGGQSNAALGTRAIVPGGVNARASGDYSFAAGRFPRTQTSGGIVHQGAFIWADSSNFFFYSTANNEFSARATGGVRFVTGIDGAGNPTAGVTVAAGGGSWASLSDVNAKSDFAPVDARAVLAKVAALPISSWRYKSQDAAIRHIGPTAQDFHAAFAMGESDRTITAVDADGVALVAIKALEALGRQRDDRIRALEAELADLRREVRAARIER